MAGAGIQKAGTTPAGAGTPSLAPVYAGVILRDDNTGMVAQCRLIDPALGTYVFDSFGRPKGTTEVRQLVLLAAKTVLGSSAMTSLGNSIFEVKTIGPTFQRDIADRLRTAFAPIVARGLMRINNIDVQQMPDNRSRGIAVLRWTDTTTGKEEATQL